MTHIHSSWLIHTCKELYIWVTWLIYDSYSSFVHTSHELGTLEPRTMYSCEAYETQTSLFSTWLFWMYIGLFWVYKGLFWVCIGLFWVYEGLFWVYIRLFWVYRALLWVYIGLLWVYIRLFWEYIGLFWVYIGHFWVYIGLFWVYIGLFGVYTGLFEAYIGLFWVYISLFWVYIGLFCRVHLQTSGSEPVRFCRKITTIRHASTTSVHRGFEYMRALLSEDIQGSFESI